MLHLLLLAREEKSSSMVRYHSSTELRKYPFADPPLLAGLHSASGLTGFRAFGDLSAGQTLQKAVPGSSQPNSHLHTAAEPHRRTHWCVQKTYQWLSMVTLDFVRQHSTLMTSLLKPQFNIILRCLDKSHWTHRKLSRWLSNQEHKQL